MSERPVVVKKWLVHGIANCTECEQSYLTVQEAARRHAASKGHRVSLDLGYAATYTPEGVTA